jgi:hypothetical protein
MSGLCHERTHAPQQLPVFIPKAEEARTVPLGAGDGEEKTHRGAVCARRYGILPLLATAVFDYQKHRVKKLKKQGYSYFPKAL